MWCTLKLSCNSQLKNTQTFRCRHAARICAFHIQFGGCPCSCYFVLSPPLHGLTERCFRQVLCVYAVICLYLQHTGEKHSTPCIRLRCVSVDLLARPPTGGRQPPLQGDDNLLSPEVVVPPYGGAQEDHFLRRFRRFKQCHAPPEEVQQVEV